MEDLLKIANELMENDNYKKEVSYEELPDGDYVVNIDKIEYKVNDKGTPWINFATTVTEGEYTERKLFFSYFLTEKTVKRSISALMNVITSFGYALDAEMFSDFETLTNCLQSLINKTGYVNKTTNGNYTNYKLTGGAE